MKVYKYEIRTEIEMTLDFEITAVCEGEARRKVEHYLEYVDKGKLDKQAISIKCKEGDSLKNCFVMKNEIQDVNSDETDN